MEGFLKINWNFRLFGWIKAKRREKGREKKTNGLHHQEIFRKKTQYNFSNRQITFYHHFLTKILIIDWQNSHLIDHSFSFLSFHTNHIILNKIEETHFLFFLSHFFPSHILPPSLFPSLSPGV